MLWNPQSLNNKISNFVQFLDDNCINLCCICETWLRTQNNTITAILREAGYRIFHFNRPEKRGGGVAILSKCEYKPKFEKCFNYSSFECIIQSFKTSNVSGNLTIMVVYRLGTESFTLFLEEFYSFVEYVKMNFKYFIICGDFNVHVNKPSDQDTINFMNILNTFSLEQSIHTSTHKLGNCLDLIIHDPECITIHDIVVESIDALTSDHSIIYFKVCFNIETSCKEEIRYRDYKSVNMSQFQTEIATTTEKYVNEANGEDFLSCVNLYSDMYSSIVDSHAPVITKVVNTVNRPPWMDTEFLEARKRRRQLFKIWKKNQTVENKNTLNESREAVHILSQDKRRMFYQNSIKSASNSHHELFKLCGNLFDTSNKSQLPYSEDHTSLANKFNNYFVEKIENIRLKLSNTSHVDFPRQPCNITSVLSTFELVTAGDIQKQVTVGKLKTAASDPIPAALLKSSIHLMVPAIVHLVNCSLRTGCMDGLKLSVVTPILKKAGLDQEVLSNYRPVCGGLYVDKIIQRNVLKQLTQHMTENDLHIAYQSAYKPNHSCETVLLAVTNDILLNLDRGLISVLMLLDNSAAFDTVDHDELLDDLSIDLGIQGTALKWFESFLKGRSQATTVKGCTSSITNTHYGVPQGSVLGPVLFNIYIRKFIKLLQDAGFTVHGYADDHQVTTTFRVEFQFSTLCSALPKVLSLISQFMTSRFLKLNAGKTKLLIFSPQNLRDNVYIESVYLGNNVSLPITNKAMNLGVKLDSMLTYSPHIDMVIRQSYNIICDIGRVRKFLTIDDIRTLVNAVIVSRLDNCNSILYGICEAELNRLQRLQNSCARLIYGRRKNDHVSDLFSELHWLPVKQRILFKILLFVFKIFIGMAPLYLETSVLITDYDNRILHIPRSNTSIGDRAFSNCAPRLWNALPISLRKAETVSYFKKHLKHLLFSDFGAFANEVNKYHTFINTH